ncbi:SDR family oxidoreductase [Pedobacter psychrodurus]|uniref:SDR family oxidoreductase n=1 Tax=Pedobacter psychrodurus TaxID=2530456 RepID=UPI002931ED12|nr:SDR family NAD(P)-dependent oxidoreductase [Pedobacter psychrodurus]
MKLQNSTILITGGTSGIGLEMVKQFIQQGATKVIITGRDAAKLERTKKQYPAIHTVQSNVSEPGDIEELYRQVTAMFPELNIIVNNAGIMRDLNLLDTSMDLHNITMEIDTNLSGTIRMVHQFLPHLLTKKTAAIVNISSGLAFIPFPLSPVYSATKAGIHAYTRILRLQLKNTGVKVFEVVPPSTETPLLNGFPDVDLEKSAPSMKVDKMVEQAIKGILKDRTEILPGMSKALKLMGRIAPNFFLNFMDRTIEKAKRK